ncbi:hypothetical protein LE190_09365 [Massilia oculi]|uniref:Uncharacterized protein n=1 Tax=Massilia hydrophila TaxID=3044279 RepID=A0ABS7YAY1_9BURK|nr:hypothetical protein [Massilia oculi]MCA1856132.1 hypothetical protein [Massilia oculi]
MVITAIILVMMANASTENGDGSDIEPTMHMTHFPPISTVTIRNNGARSSASGKPADQCADFQLSAQEIGEYISKAAEVAEHDYFHMLDWSPCYASGSVVFKNGVTGTWAIQQYRAGSLTLSTGRTFYLYCPRCYAKAFPPADE